MIEIFTDTDKIDRQKLYLWLDEAYWSKGRPRELIAISLENSLCFSAWIEGQMVGFARVVSDYATFAWLCDVFVDPDSRGQGVGKALVATVMQHSNLQTVRWMLGTRDAHSLYEAFGFANVEEPDRFMVKGFAPRPSRNTWECPEGRR